MRMMIFAALVALATVVAATGCGGHNYDCQPICRDALGGITVADTTYTIEASDEMAAQAACEDDGNHANPPVCNAGSTVDGCSCTAID